MEQLERLDIAVEKLNEGASPLEQRVWEQEVNEKVKKRGFLQQHLKIMCSLMWEQCTPLIKAKLESLANFQLREIESDSIELLKGLRAITFNIVEQNKYKP